MVRRNQASHYRGRAVPEIPAVFTFEGDEATSRETFKIDVEFCAAQQLYFRYERRVVLGEPFDEKSLIEEILQVST